jgi:hypothetical protein
MKDTQAQSRDEQAKSRRPSPQPTSTAPGTPLAQPAGLATGLAQGPRMTAQRQAIEAAFGPAAANSSPATAQLVTLVAQCERTVTNRMKQNMQDSLARVFGGPASRYTIDQESGTTFPDGPPHHTTGHHGIQVTDSVDGTTYTCDFHQDGAYYTRG